jgi:hypothetical protein
VLPVGPERLVAYSDRFDFIPQDVEHSVYSDGTDLPRLEIEVTRNGENIGYCELHLHRTKYSPHVSLGLTSRLRSD